MDKKDMDQVCGDILIETYRCIMRESIQQEIEPSISLYVCMAELAHLFQKLYGRDNYSVMKDYDAIYSRARDIFKDAK